MPNHDYKCGDCGEVFERFTWLADLHHVEKLHPVCPKCKSTYTERQPSLFARTPGKWVVESNKI